MLIPWFSLHFIIRIWIFEPVGKSHMFPGVFRSSNHPQSDEDHQNNDDKYGDPYCWDSHIHSPKSVEIKTNTYIYIGIVELCERCVIGCIYIYSQLRFYWDPIHSWYSRQFPATFNSQWRHWHVYHILVSSIVNKHLPLMNWQTIWIFRRKTISISEIKKTVLGSTNVVFVI